MSENKMGYRGSKSNFIVKFVKEQRVDGSYFGYNSKLRCTLMGGESRYQLNIPSKQIIIQTRNLSIDSQKICKHLICKKNIILYRFFLSRLRLLPSRTLQIN